MPPAPPPDLLLKDAALDLLSRLGVAAADWDMLVCGDGSGSTWERGCGWGAVSFERTDLRPRYWWGFVNRGSVNMAELMAYLQPLLWLANREADRVAQHGGRRRAYRVHIVTDSQYAQKTGTLADPLVERNGPLWEQFHSFVRQGVLLHWHWLPRASHPLNALADRLSRLSRTAFQAYNLQEGANSATETEGEAGRTGG